MPTTELADKAAADAAAKAAADTAAADKATADKAAAEKATVDKAAADKVAADAAAAGKKSEGGEAVKDDDKSGTVGAPEKYALTLPEGGAVDASDLALIEKLAREHNLPNDAAQGLLEQHNTMLVEYSAGLAAQLKADPDYGGDKLADTQRLAKTIIDRVRPEGHPRRAAFMAKLDKSGAGNDVEIASFLADLGKMTAEDTPVAGGSGGSGEKPIANRMYPNQA